jgi:hypothetical protein
VLVQAVLPRRIGRSKIETGIQTFGDALMAGERFAVIRGERENAFLRWAHFGDDCCAGFNGPCILAFVLNCVLWFAPRWRSTRLRMEPLCWEPTIVSASQSPIREHSSTIAGLGMQHIETGV